MLYVERIYARRGLTRRWPRRVVGHHAEFGLISTSDWNKKQSGNRWFIMMVFNRAALHMESGVPKQWARRAYERYLRYYS